MVCLSVYVDSTDGDCVSLNFQIGHGISQRMWNIKVLSLNILMYCSIDFLFYWQVTQYDCSSPVRAPVGCNQWFYGELFA